MIIREFELFDGMSDDLIEEMMSIMQSESHPSGTVLFRKGDPAEYLYILTSGRLELTLPGKGQTRKVAAEKPGQIVGWSSLAGRDNYSSDVTCTEDSKVTKLERRAVEKLLRSYPSDGRLFYKHLASVVGQRLIACHEALEEAHQEMVA